MSQSPKKKSSKAPRSTARKRAGSEQVRLQKVLADAGIGSRRGCEELITDGRVQVDRKIVTELGTKVDPDKQEVRVDGQLVKPKRHKYFMVNKPVGVVCTNSDPEGRRRVIDLIATDERLFTVGRLDRTSEGLILVTNDGELANKLAHPRYGVEKTYIVRVVGRPTFAELQPLKDGVRLAEGFAKVDFIKIRKRFQNATELEIILKEGKNREIRRVLARIGHKVTSLKRVAVGEIRLGSLPSGGVRQLTSDELSILRQSAASQGKKSSKGKKKSTKSAHASKSSPNKGRGSAGGRKRPAKGKMAKRKKVSTRRTTTKRKSTEPTASRRKGKVLNYGSDK